MNPRPSLDPTQQTVLGQQITGNPTPAGSAPSADPESRIISGLRALLTIEADARNAMTLEQLQFIFANEPRKLTAARQIFVFKQQHFMKLVAISGLPAVDSSAPVVRGMEAVIAGLINDKNANVLCEFDLADQTPDTQDLLTRYPYQKLLWVPIRMHDGPVLGGMLLVSEQAWGKNAIAVAKRLADTYAHAQSLLLVKNRLGRGLKIGSKLRHSIAIATVIAVLAAMAIPVPMTALAPMEITPREPFIVAAPLDGAIHNVLVAPNEVVKKGQPIVRFEDTALRNRLEIAEREVLIAEARLKKASQQAFDDVRGRHEVGLAMAEHELKTAEFNYARELLDRTTIRAERDGIAIYTDRQELIGKPVTLGERIMQIADPMKINVTIDVDVADAIVLKPGADAKVFLDTDPLSSRQATVEFADYKARVRPGGTLAFQVVANLQNTSDQESPRLGARGTAQLYGEDVPLVLYLFRRPISAVRQWIGQ